MKFGFVPVVCPANFAARTQSRVVTPTSSWVQTLLLLQLCRGGQNALHRIDKSAQRRNRGNAWRKLHAVAAIWSCEKTGMMVTPARPPITGTLMKFGFVPVVCPANFAARTQSRVVTPTSSWVQTLLLLQLCHGGQNALHRIDKSAQRRNRGNAWHKLHAVAAILSCEKTGMMVTPAWPPITGTLMKFGFVPVVCPTNFAARTQSRVVTPTSSWVQT